MLGDIIANVAMAIITCHPMLKRAKAIAVINCRAITASTTSQGFSHC